MKTKYTFRHMRKSEEKIQYVEERLGKLEKYEWRPLTAHVTFSAERNQCTVDIRLTGQGASIKAKAKADHFSDAVDEIVGKLQKQLEKKKSRVQEHHVFENSHLGKIERLMPPNRKVS